MRYNKLFIGMLVVCVLALSTVSSVQPFGVETIVEGSSTRAGIDLADSTTAIAGNVTELTITGFSTTQAWQGYFGNVSGTIQLVDGADNVMYNWSLADPEGEVYASETGDTINWTGIKCWDMATDNAALEASYDIVSNDVDGVDETFNWTTHSEFFVNNIQIDANSCNSTRIFNSNGKGEAADYEEVILEGGSGEVIWTAIIEEASIIGFDQKDHDFQMLVPEDGHDIDTATRQYYFYVELE
ncbi:MAG: hypothetical protein PF542_02240 [Nanoarchaeota archaeon]|jgi:hypothetical protein|nr:hypothetical protein [Nanoarchaeota archaeon]